MAMKSSHKWIVAIVAILIILVIVYFIYKSNTEDEVPTTTTTTTTPGLLGTTGLAGIAAWVGGLFGGKPKTDPCSSVQCDPNRPGWDSNGLYNNCCA